MDALNAGHILWSLVAAAFTACLAIAGWTSRCVVNLKGQLAALEADSFDADKRGRLWERIGQLERQVAEARPPEWLLQRLDRIETKLDELTRHVLGRGG